MKEKKLLMLLWYIFIIVVVLYVIRVDKTEANEKHTEEISTESTEAIKKVRVVIETEEETESTEETTMQETEESSVEETKEAKKKSMSENDKYLLAKIAMAEAEGCSLRAKELVIETVLSRVKSDKFPNTVEEVIFQKNQFTPTFDGRWNRVEPNEDCWKAVENVLKNGVKKEVLFFESCKGDSWHNRNLEFVCQEDTLRFYK